MGESGIKRCYLKKCVWRRIKNKVRNRLVRCLRPGFKGFLRHCSPVSLLLSRSVRPFCWWLCPLKKKNASLQRSRMDAAKRTLKQANNVWRNRVGSLRGRILVFSVRKVFSSPAPSSRPKRSKLAPLLRESSFYSSALPFPLRSPQSAGNVGRERGFTPKGRRRSNRRIKILFFRHRFTSQSGESRVSARKISDGRGNLR